MPDAAGHVKRSSTRLYLTFAPHDGEDARHSLKGSIKYKDTVSYFGINIGVVTRWFLRVFTNGPRKSLVTRLPIEQAALLAPGFQVEATPESMGKSRIYFNVASDIERLRALVIIAYEEEMKRRESAPADEAAETAA